jgi:hypothetical protein
VIARRGTAKTALLTVITDHAANEHGAVIVRWTAGSRPLHHALDSDTRRHADSCKPG